MDMQERPDMHLSQPFNHNTMITNFKLAFMKTTHQQPQQTHIEIQL